MDEAAAEPTEAAATEAAPDELSHKDSVSSEESEPIAAEEPPAAAEASPFPPERTAALAALFAQAAGGAPDQIFAEADAAQTPLGARNRVENGGICGMRVPDRGLFIQKSLKVAEENPRSKFSKPAQEIKANRRVAKEIFGHRRNVN